jgi:hypothetical protein
MPLAITICILDYLHQWYPIIDRLYIDFTAWKNILQLAALILPSLNQLQHQPNELSNSTLMRHEPVIDLLQQFQLFL